jgi:biotin operon repressor
MARPTARVLALLETLQSGGIRTVPDLAARLEVDERTVRRYADHLRDLGVPVRSVRGRYVTHWTDLPRGGHFLEWEVPDLIAQDVRTFLRDHR